MNIVVGNINNIEKHIEKEIENSKSYGKNQDDFFIKKTVEEFNKGYTSVYFNLIYEKLVNFINGKEEIKDAEILKNRKGELFVSIGDFIFFIDDSQKSLGKNKKVKMEVYKFYERLPDNLKMQLENYLEEEKYRVDKNFKFIKKISLYDVNDNYTKEAIINRESYNARYFTANFYLIPTEKDGVYFCDHNNVNTKKHHNNLINDIENLKRIFGIEDVKKDYSENLQGIIYGNCNELKKTYANRIALMMKGIYENQKHNLNDLFATFKEMEMDLNKRIIFNDMDETNYFKENEKCVIYVQENQNNLSSTLNIFWKDINGNIATWDIYPCHTKVYLPEEDADDEEKMDYISVLSDSIKWSEPEKTFMELLKDKNIEKYRALSYDINKKEVTIDFDNIHNYEDLGYLMENNIEYSLKNAKVILNNENKYSRLEILDGDDWVEQKNNMDMKI